MDCSFMSSAAAAMSPSHHHQLLLPVVAAFVFLLTMCAPHSQALPMQAPDAASCKPQYSAKFRQTVDCCLGADTFNSNAALPGWTPDVRSGTSNSSTGQQRRPGLRVRKPAHMLTEAEKARLDRAYRLMKALPESDPRSFAFQSRLHCFYTYPALRAQVDHPTVEYNVHLNWLFHPFHRLLTYFHERILASLLEDDEDDGEGDEFFALPFWNWDNQDASSHPLPNAVPWAYQDPVGYPALFDANRGPWGDQIADLTTNSLAAVAYQNEDELRAINNELMHRIMVESSRHAPELFFSTPIHPGESATRADRPDCYMEEFEGVVHGGVHLWTGGFDGTGRDMGAAWTAAADPIFYAHHANVDRLWTVWRTLDGGRPDIDDPDWLDSEFLFYNEHAELVRVIVRDALSPEALGYTYLDVENPWIEATQPASSR